MFDNSVVLVAYCHSALISAQPSEFVVLRAVMISMYHHLSCPLVQVAPVAAMIMAARVDLYRRDGPVGANMRPSSREEQASLLMRCKV